MRRTRHKAAGARVAATGLSVGALLSMVGAIGANAGPETSRHRRQVSTAAALPRPVRRAPQSPPTTVVWRVVRHVVYVDDPPAVTATVGGSPGGAPGSHAAAPTYAPSPADAPAPPPAGTAPAVPTAVPSAPAPPPPPVAVQPAPAPMPVCSGTKCP